MNQFKMLGIVGVAVLISNGASARTGALAIPGARQAAPNAGSTVTQFSQAQIAQAAQIMMRNSSANAAQEAIQSVFGSQAPAIVGALTAGGRTFEQAHTAFRSQADSQAIANLLTGQSSGTAALSMLGRVASGESVESLVNGEAGVNSRGYANNNEVEVNLSQTEISALVGRATAEHQDLASRIPTGNDADAVAERGNIALVQKAKEERCAADAGSCAVATQVVSHYVTASTMRSSNKSARSVYKFVGAQANTLNVPVNRLVAGVEVVSGKIATGNYDAADHAVSCLLN